MKSKTFLFVLLAFCIVNMAFSQVDFSDKISIDEYKTWAESFSFNSMKFREYDKEGNAEYGEPVKYGASYLDEAETQAISLWLSQIGEFESDKMMAKSKGNEPFSIGGKEAVFVKTEGEMAMAILSVKDEDLPATITLMAIPAIEKNELVSMYQNIPFDDLDKPLEWPDEIPAEARINSTVLSIDKQPASTDGFQYEYHVVALMNDDLIAELERILSHYDSKDLMNVKINESFIFICGNAENIKWLKEDKRNGDAVEFIYYKNE